ncbi:hypothetical protein [Paracoccus chinensis]|uniref:hypothetical protein n=1 Tax=Paracoccus chinensis TaxID=525640 RepID=UPI0011143534|nr:hypothetical protein [Paracoccus chinensis]
MAVWPIFEDRHNVITVDIAKARYKLSDEGFQMGLSSGRLAEEVQSVVGAMRSYEPRRLVAAETENFQFVAPAALPGSNEQPLFEYLGVYFSGIHFIPGSREARFDIMLAFNIALTVAGGYNDLREAVPQFVRDVQSAVDFLEQQLAPRPLPPKWDGFKIYDVRRPETVENAVVSAMLKGGSEGIEL